MFEEDRPGEGESSVVRQWPHSGILRGPQPVIADSDKLMRN